MENASEFVYLNFNKIENEDDNEDILSVCSDELNRSFESNGSDDEADDFMGLDQQQNFMLASELSSKEGNALDENEQKLDMFCFDSLAQPQTSDATSIPCQIPDNMAKIPLAPSSPRLANRMMPPPPSMIPTMPSSSMYPQMVPPQNIPTSLMMQRRASFEVFAEPEPQMSKKKSKQEKSRHNRQGRKFKHEIDTNVICLKLKVLKDDAQLAAGDPIFCQGCKAVSILKHSSQ